MASLEQLLKKRRLRAEGLQDVHTVGGVVTPAQPLLLVVPDTAQLVVEASVENKDVGFVHPGQRAEVKVETFAFTRYGMIDGTVTALSRDAVIDTGSRQDAGGQKQGTDDKEGGHRERLHMWRALVWIETGSIPRRAG